MAKKKETMDAQKQEMLGSKASGHAENSKGFSSVSGMPTKNREHKEIRETAQKVRKVKVVKPKILTVSGKRKTAIAKATIREGNGRIRINKKPIETYSFFRRLVLSEPFKIAEGILKDDLKKYDIDVTVVSGGTEAQIDAARLAIARALVAFTQNAELKSAFLGYDRTLLVADVRRKEMRKPGDSKARARRQTSYR